MGKMKIMLKKRTTIKRIDVGNIFRQANIF
jgi:hypothetical protein